MAYFHTTVLDEQVKALPTVDTASGAIATFDTDLTENLVSVKCQIVAQQASGTPSPSNPLPITVFSQADISVCGINVWDEVWEVGRIDGITGNNYPSSDRIRSKNYIPIKPNTTYRIAMPTDGLWVYWYDINKGYSPRSNYDFGSTFTTPSNCYYIRFEVYSTYGATYNNDISINYPSSDTQYHAYTGNLYTVSFGQTVANGVLDVTTGKLRVTQQIKTFDGSENWVLQASSTNNNVFLLNSAVTDILDENGQNSNMFSFNASAFSANDNYENTFVLGGSKRLFVQVAKTTAIDATAFKALLSNTNLQVIYNITPIEIQLDSITVQALLNENNIWCDTGDTEVKFLLTVGKKIS